MERKNKGSNLCCMMLNLAIKTTAKRSKDPENMNETDVSIDKEQQCMSLYCLEEDLVHAYS